MGTTAEIDRAPVRAATSGGMSNGRFVLGIGSGAFTLIDESYNANPASMRAAIALLRDAEPQDGGRRIAVLGDMLELGEESAALHAEVGRAAAAGGADLIDIACDPELVARVAAAAPGLAGSLLLRLDGHGAEIWLKRAAEAPPAPPEDAALAAAG